MSPFSPEGPNGEMPAFQKIFEALPELYLILSTELIIIADNSKLVRQLGKFPLPVEVIPFGYKQVEQKIMTAGICKNVTLRKKNDKPFMTDHHHYILDCAYE